jgi:hypothetical protein
LGKRTAQALDEITSNHRRLDKSAEIFLRLTKLSEAETKAMPDGKRSANKTFLPPTCGIN